MIYFVNGKAKFAFGDKSLNDNVKQILDSIKHEKLIKKSAA